MSDNPQYFSIEEVLGQSPKSGTVPTFPSSEQYYSVEDVLNAPTPSTAPTTGILPNIAAGLAESSAPGVAGLIASPLDIPINVGRAAYESVAGFPGHVTGLAKGIGSTLGLTEPETKQDFIAREKASEAPIPASPVGAALTGLAEQAGLPTPSSPIKSIVPANEIEAGFRRGAQIGGQVATTIAGSKVFAPFTPTTPSRIAGSLNPALRLIPEAQQPAALTTRNLVAGFLAPPTFFRSAPAISTGTVAAGADAVSQQVELYGKEHGWTDEEIRLAQRAARGLATGVGAVGQVGLSTLGEKTGINPLLRLPGQEIAAGGWLGPYSKERALNELAGESLARTPAATLAEGGTWEPSTADVGSVLRSQNTATLAQQEANLASQVQGLRATPEDIGNRLRTNIGKQKAGPIADVMTTDQSGKFTVPNSDVPSKLFNEKLKPEDLSKMLFQAKGDFRKAFHDAGVNRFLGDLEKRDISGNLTGQINVNEVPAWQKKFGPILDAYERTTKRLWGTADTSIRDNIANITSKQQALNETNAAKAKLNGQTVNNAISEIYDNAGQQVPVTAMKELSDNLKPDPDAHNALKRDWMQFGLEKAQQDLKTELAMRDPGLIANIRAKLFGGQTLTLPNEIRQNSRQIIRNFNEFLKNNEPVAKELFGDKATSEMIKNIENYAGYRQPKGVWTFLDGIAGLSLIGDAIGLGLPKVLATFGHVHPMISGAIGGAMAATALARFLRASGATNVNDLLVKSITNPEAMKALTSSVKNPGTMTKFLRNMGVSGTVQEMSPVQRYQPMIPGLTQ